MKRFRYSNFLNDKEVYEQNRKFWVEHIKKAQPDSYEWMKNEFKNGVKIYDGNPLVSYRYENTAIRIIQIDIDKTIPKLMIWGKKYEDTKINEIVIHIQPYSDVYQDIIQFVELFFKDRFRRSQIRLNKKYYKEFSITRKKYMISVIKKLENEDSPIITNKRLSPNQARIIKIATRRLPILKARSVDSKMFKGYNKTAKILYSINKFINKNLTNLEINKLEDEIKEIKEALDEFSEP